MKLIIISFLIIFIIFFIIIVSIKSTKKTIQIKNLKKTNNMIIQWSEEIKDPDIRAQFLQFTLKYIYPKYQKDKKDPQFIEIKKMV